jgi:glycosyltransferase involved in cell wall biosynthesis
LSSEVAIIIPCYNHGQYLREAVQSALRQDIKAEVIVIDDGSTDAATIAVLDDLRASGVFVHPQVNKGLPEARNAGIKLTSADFIVCLDADDMLQPAYCSTCLEVMQVKPEIGFVYTTTRVFGTKDKLWSRQKFSGLHVLIDNYIPYSAMFRRQLWEDINGYSAEMKNKYEDWDFWLSAIEKGWKGFHVPRDLFWYRKHGDSMLTFSNLSRKSLKQILRSRHRQLYSFRNITRMMIAEYFPLPRLAWTILRENVLRTIYTYKKNI